MEKQFSGIGRAVWALGADGPRVYDIYLMTFLAKVFEKMLFRRTVRGPQADNPLFFTKQGAARWTGRTVRGLPADSPRGPGGRSAWLGGRSSRPNGQSPQPLTSRFYH
jgi:hypothetical protein